MGQTTPSGVTEQTKNQQEQNPAAVFDAQPDAFHSDITEFFTELDEVVQDDPAAEDAANLLIREIQETTGLYTDNPDMQAQASSRMEQLNTAIQDSNMPEEIKASFNNIYTASIDNPHYLHELNGFIQQGGGSIAGIAGAAQRLQEEEVTRRNNENNRASAVGTAAMISAAQAKLQAHLDDFFKEQEALINETMQEANTIERTQGAEAAGSHIADKLERKIQEAFDKAKEDNPDLTIEEFMEKIEPQLEKLADENNVSGTASAFGIQELRTRISKDDNDITAITQNNHNLISSVFTPLAYGKEFGANNAGVPSFETKEDLAQLIETHFEETTNKLVERRVELEERKAEYKALEENFKGFFGPLQSLFGLNDDDKDLMEQMKEDIAEQEIIITLQEEINALSQVEAEKFLNRVEDPSDIDLDFLKQAFLDMDPELAAKTAELNQRLGLEETNPIAQLQAMLTDEGVELTEEQRAELTAFVETVTEMKEKLAEADQEFENQAVAAINNVTADGIIIQQDNGWGGVPSIISPEQRLNYAYDEKQRLQEELATYVQEQGVSIKAEAEIEQEEAPAPAPDEPSSFDIRATELAQKLSAMDSVTRADLEQIVYNDNWVDSMQDDMEAKVEAELLAINPDFKFADMSVDDQIVLAFIENEGTLSQQDIELIVSEAGVDGSEFQMTVDTMIAKYSNHEGFRIDPPVTSAAAEYEPDEQDIAATEPAPTQQPNEPEPEEQEYAYAKTQSPAVPL